MTKCNILMDVLVLFCRPPFRDENFSSAKMFSASSRVKVRKSSFLNSKVSLAKFVLRKRKVSH